ncbi:MAG: hypothetical protein A2Y10_18150 [Planctomycetes bacterium GWF2_41_51]|nr:MAG: hypothetical protein A2Y10_18150 [Planctomycetes bacterium GWF2_41_51]
MKKLKAFQFVIVYLTILTSTVFSAVYWCPDLTGEDDFVNFADFTKLAENWQQSGSGLNGDFDGSSTVDINDLATFAGYWLDEIHCAQYYEDTLPYLTSFEDYQGYTTPPDPCNLNGQMGWQVVSGDVSTDYWWFYRPEPDDYFYYQYVIIDSTSTIVKSFEDTGSNHEYIRFNFIPAKDQKINILNGNNIVASVWFNATDWKIYVLNNGSYVNTNVNYQSVYNNCWSNYEDMYEQYAHDYYNTWTNITFQMNFGSNTYKVYWNGGTSDIANNAPFNTNYDTLTAIKIETTSADWGVLNRVSISSQADTGLSLNIESPCACHDDLELKGRVAINGTAWGENFGCYDVYICPTDLDTQSWDNWTKICTGNKIIPSTNLLGYWDTSIIPNGTYFIGTVLFDDTGYAPNGFEMIWKTISIGGQTVYEGPGYFPVLGELKGNTFYHEEEPDISVQWQGQIPFELKRSFNNNRKLYNKPFRYGWTHNYQIILQEEAAYSAETEQSGPFRVASWDAKLLGIGTIWVQNPDGSRRLFRHTSGHVSSGPVYYYPYPNDGSGDYIKRYSYDDWGIIYEVSYYLVTRDGTQYYFSDDSLDVPAWGPYGSIGWSVKAGVSSISDRFGNGLGIGWDYYKTAVTSISDGRSTIEFDITDGFYTQARLRVGGNVYRTVNYEWDNTNKIFIVAKTGYGVNENGVYDGSNLKEHETNYQYEESSGGGYNLIKIVYSNDLNNKSIEVNYDGYNRISTRKDYVETDNYLTTNYDYTFYHPYPGNREISYLITEVNTPFQTKTILQNEKGNMLKQWTIPVDGSAVLDVNALYEDNGNPYRPTTTVEFFDGKERQTDNSYNSYGDLTKQKVYVDDVNYVAAEFEYHPNYPLPTRQTNWQDINETGALVEKLSVYGEADGSENQSGKYLVKEKQLIAEDPNEWATTSYKYLSNGLVIRETDANGFITFHQYDNNNYRKLVKKGKTDSNEPVQRFYNDALGQVRLVANSLGGVILSDYDDFGRLWRIRKYSDASAMTINDATFIPSRYEGMTALSTIIYGYDLKGNKTYEKKEAGGEIFTNFTTNNQPKRATYDDDSYVEYSYDSRGLKREEHKYDSVSTEDYNTIYAYDDMGRNIQTLWYDYDDEYTIKGVVAEYFGNNKVKFSELYGYDNYLEKRVDYAYDILDRLTSRTEAGDSLNLTTSYGYDAANNRIRVTDPNGNIIYTAYDNANRKIAEFFAASSGTEITQADVRKEFNYYQNGQIKDVNSYDYDGNLLARSQFEYDARNRVTKVTQDINETVQAVTNYYYNDAGFTYDSEEYQIRITDAEGKYTHIAVDEFGNKAITLYPSGDYEHLEYNPDGTLSAKAVWDANNTKRWIKYFYDGYGRLRDANYPDNGNVHYSYDGIGRKKLIEDNRNATDNIGGSEQIAYGYDVLNRIVSVTEQDDYETTYAYQADGQKQSIRVYAPNDTLIYDVAYTYDEAGRLFSVEEPMAGFDSYYIAQFEFDKNGNRKNLTYNPIGWFFGEADVTINYSYNRDNMLTGFTTTGGPTFTMSNAEIDGLGRLLSCDEMITEPNSASINLSYAYEYDMQGNLTYSYLSQPSGVLSEISYSMTYDKIGNVQTYELAIGEESHNFERYYNGDILTGDQLDGQPYRRLNYDLNGRQGCYFGGDPNFNPFEYDWDGRLNHSFSVIADSYGKARYTPDGICCWRQFHDPVGTENYKYIVDFVGDVPQNLLIFKVDHSNVTSCSTYIHAGGQVLFQHANVGTGRHFFMHDRLGSVKQIFDPNGNVNVNYNYDSFGIRWRTKGDFSEIMLNNPYQWAGYYLSPGAMGYYLNARYYDPATFRFTTRDPVKGSYNEPMTLHPYLYCLNDPINATDPTGMTTDTVASVGIGLRMWAASLQVGGRALAIAGRVALKATMVGVSTYLVADAVMDERNRAMEESLHFHQDIVSLMKDRNKFPAPFPRGDKFNVEDIIDNYNKTADNEQPPKDPWKKFWFYLGKVLEQFHKD